MTDTIREQTSAPSDADERRVTSERQAAFTVPGLSAAEGEEVADALQGRLVSLIDLGLTLKHIHWNVVGPSFIGVHEMLDPQYAAVAEMTDALAERIATLGGVPSGLPGRLVESRTWDDYDLGRADTQAHLGALDQVYIGVIADHRAAYARIGEIDAVSEDLLIGQTAQLEQFHWFVRTHLADWAGGIATAGTNSERSAAAAAVRRTQSGETGGRESAEAAKEELSS